MAKAYTYCRDCANLSQVTEKRHPTQWLCLRFPRLEGGGFVDPERWVEMEPYMKCMHINGGNCPLFEPIPEPETEVKGERIHRSDYEQ